MATSKTIIMAAVNSILCQIEDMSILRPELKDTPYRVFNAWREMFDGYDTDINSLFKTFDGEGSDQLVIVKNIEATSFCEHHFLQFDITAHVGYLPNGRVIGASKIPRLVLAYAHRLQIQERIAEQVANTIMDKLQPKGVAVVIEGTHSCMRCRGVKVMGCSLVNSIMLGSFRDNSSLRAEFLSLIGRK